MNVFQRINKVIEYIEENLIGEIDYKKASQIAACPISLFQRFFVYMTNITLSEYIRRRRLTLCAIELQENKGKIIDVALKYGYESHSSFSRAFRDFHGISPSQANEQGATFNIFPVLVFPVLYIMEGAIKMADERVFEIFEGIRYRFDIIEMPQSLKFVGLTGEDNIEKYHQEYVSLVSDKYEPYTEIRLWFGNSTTNEKGDWIYGCVVNELKDIPKGLVGADTGFTKFAVMTIKRNTIDELFEYDTFAMAHRNFMNLLPFYYKDKVCPSLPGATRGFATIGGSKPRDTSLIEIYPRDLFEKIETCFYIPLIK